MVWAVKNNILYYQNENVRVHIIIVIIIIKLSCLQKNTAYNSRPTSLAPHYDIITAKGVKMNSIITLWLIFELCFMYLS